MKLIFLALLTTITIGGCAGGGVKACKAGATAADFERDKYDCEMKTRSGSPAMVLVDFELEQRCMTTEKGWHKCSAEELKK